MAVVANEEMKARAAGIDPAPQVELLRWFETPHDQSVGAARTCYSSRVIYPHEVSKDEKARGRRDAIARSIYRAGHHTTIQHPTFQFVLQNVSRHLIWSFLHSHTFYNSEQVSQRYVSVRRGRYAVPPLSEEQTALYHACAAQQMETYERLVVALRDEAAARFFRIFPGRRASADKWAKAIEKRALEIARYVLPVATHAHLYHTISGVTLYRYWRLQHHYDTPLEQRLVVEAMVAAVREKDPDFFQNLDDPLPLEETPEHRALLELHGRADGLGGGAAMVEAFDASLEGRRSRLVDWKARAEQTLADAVRTVLGATPDRLSDDAALGLALDPARDTYLGQALNVTTHAKLTRALFHPHYTFRKKLSHTADSQDQRHRMTPGSRPILAAHYVPGRPDYITPELIEAVPAAQAIYDRSMAETWRAIDRLLELGAASEHALYLLPNAFPIRFEESGDLLNQHHKWTLRLCYLAQEEIWRASKEEVAQVAEVHPRIARHILAPCGLRKRAGHTPFCPEGARFCGSPVWDLAVTDYARLL